MKLTYAVLAIVLSTFSFSTSAAPVVVQPGIPDNSGPHLTLGIGLTFGGDKVGTVYYTNGDSTNLYAGRKLHFYGGMMYHFFNSPFAARLTFGIHTEFVSGTNGSVFFNRTTLEAVPFYYMQPYSRIGLGLIRHMSPTLDATDIGGGSFTFNDATGTEMEFGYNFSGRAWLDFRYVSISYDADGYSGSVDGSHFGIYLSTEF